MFSLQMCTQSREDPPGRVHHYALKKQEEITN